MLVMLVVPALEAASFWVLLRHKDTSRNPLEVNPENAKPRVDNSALPENERPLESWRQKLNYIPSLFIYMIPLILVYLFEYFINQGLVSDETCRSPSFANPKFLRNSSSS